MTSWEDLTATVARLTGALERQADELRATRTNAETQLGSERLLRPDEVAVRLSKSRAWVYRNQHALGGFRVGGQVRFSSDDIAAYVRRCRASAPGPVPGAAPLLPFNEAGASPSPQNGSRTP